MIGIVVTIFAMLATTTTASSPDGVILILADDFGAENVGLYGSTRSTPNLDKLGKHGATFERFFSQPMCAPSRAQLMSGRYPHETGITENWKRLGSLTHLDPSDCVLPNVFKSRGYETSVFLKWHLGLNQDACGFDTRLVWKEQRNPDMRYNLPTFYTNIQNFTNFNKTEDVTEFSPFEMPEYTPRWAFDLMKRYVTQKINNLEKFFVYYPMFLNHKPFDLGTPPDLRGNISKNQKFELMTQQIDKYIGELLEIITSNTLIVFLGDNGNERSITTRIFQPGGSQLAVKGGKFTITDRGTRVPSLWFWASKINASTVIQDVYDLSSINRIFSEILDSGEFRLPESRGYTFVRNGDKYAIRGTRFSIRDDGEVYDHVNMYKPVKPRTFHPEIKFLYDHMLNPKPKLRVIQGCIKYNSAGLCSKCDPELGGPNFNRTGCVPCIDPNCIKCNKNFMNCRKCNEGFRKVSKRCIQTQ